MSLFLVLSTKTSHVIRLMDSRKEIGILEHWDNKTIWLLGFVITCSFKILKFIYAFHISSLQSLSTVVHQKLDCPSVRLSQVLNPVWNAIRRPFI